MDAIKVSEKGEVRIVLERAGDETRPWTQLSVYCTATGIRVEEEPQLFQELTQADGSAREVIELGLDLSQKLAGLLGGQVSLHGERGKESTFTLSLPESYKGYEPRNA